MPPPFVLCRILLKHDPGMFNFLLLFNNVSLIVNIFGCIFRIFVCRIFQLSHLLETQWAFALNLLLLLNTVLDLFTIGFLGDRDDLAQDTIDWGDLAPVLRPLSGRGGHILKNDQTGAGLVSEGRMGVDVYKHLHKHKPHTSPTHNRYRKGACAHRTTPWGRSLACCGTDMSSHHVDRRIHYFCDISLYYHNGIWSSLRFGLLLLFP